MGPLRELLATDQRQALEFFFQRLKDVAGPAVDPPELLYNASLLAHYAQVSTGADMELAAPTTLSAVFDRFVLDSTLRRDRQLLEAAGAQCLVLAGFFENQMRRRHNIRWYARLGAGFLKQAALLEPSPHRAQLLDTVASRFEAWRQRHARLGRELHDQPFLLARPTPP